jgi:anti-anti-sigma factor
MNIDLQHLGSAAILRLEGRLDVAWAEHVLGRAQEELRGGRRCLLLDAAGLTYLSSAGIRILLQLRRDVKAVQGQFFVVRPSEFVENALRMSGLDVLLATAEQVAALTSEPTAESPGAGGSETVQGPAGIRMERHPLEAAAQMRLRAPARWSPWGRVRDGDVHPVALPSRTLALGIGAASHEAADARLRFGEFLGAAGCLCWQPADAQQHLPDFVVEAGNLVPEIWAIQALVAEGDFPWLLRFEPEEAGGGLLLSQLAGCALETARSDAAVLVALAETDGLVGMALSRSPGLLAEESDPAQFPEIRDWMNFCGERVHSGRSALVVAVVAKEGAAGALAPLLAPLPSNPEIRFHGHAAAFAFRPLPNGAIPMAQTVRSLFEARDPLDLLHLVEDDRPLTGLGQSSFVRGACWVAPVRLGEGGSP